MCVARLQDRGNGGGDPCDETVPHTLSGQGALSHTRQSSSITQGGNAHEDDFVHTDSSMAVAGLLSLMVVGGLGLGAAAHAEAGPTFEGTWLNDVKIVTCPPAPHAVIATFQSMTTYMRGGLLIEGGRSGHSASGGLAQRRSRHMGARGSSHLPDTLSLPFLRQPRPSGQNHRGHQPSELDQGRQSRDPRCSRAVLSQWTGDEQDHEHQPCRWHGDQRDRRVQRGDIPPPALRRLSVQKEPARGIGAEMSPMSTVGSPAW